MTSLPAIKKAATPRRYQRDAKAAAKLASAIVGISDAWLDCRDMRHAWKVHTDFHVAAFKGIQQITRVLVCIRCETRRKELYSHSGFGLDKTRQVYEYPQGYQIKGVPRGVKPKNIVQEEQYRRALEKLAGSARNSGR